MNYVKERFLIELTVKKSKFIAVIYPLESKESLEGILLTLKKEFPKATHYCYAYIIDSYMKSSDDGEPSQTAGKPILNIILKHNLNIKQHKNDAMEVKASVSSNLRWDVHLEFNDTGLKTSRFFTSLSK